MFSFAGTHKRTSSGVAHRRGDEIEVSLFVV
jgi:hypothetical protein